MKSFRVRYTAGFTPGPMTIWVHRRYGPGSACVVPGPGVGDAPALPGVVAGKGYALIEIEFDGVRFVFASLAELGVFREVLGRPLLPRPQGLDPARVRRYANSHWLSRLPAKAKPWRYRRRLVRYLDTIDASVRAAWQA
ncbi:MAG: hypothetical protein H6842_07440 [Rhodospirillaceae bacterium]|nr:hypothetical protein [Rhodospirillaceae bacterium]